MSISISTAAQKPLDGIQSTADSNSEPPRMGSVVYPVLSLPHEITSEIFLHCLPPIPELRSDAESGPSVALAPLLLIQICRTWRNVALSTPQLWNNLHLILADLHIGLDEVELERCVVDWFYRAGSCPLSFSVAVGSPFNDGFGADAIKAILRRHAPHLQTVSLQLEMSHFRVLANSLARPFPALETLSLAVKSNRGSYPPGGLRAFSVAPRLHHLSVGDAARLRMFVLPYEGLSQVTCDLLSGDEFLDLIHGAPFLQELTCSVSWTETIIFHAVPIVHDHLRTLRLIYNSSTDFTRFVCLPALETLHLSLEIRNVPANRNFLAFLAHSAASLRRFSTATQIKQLNVEWFTTMRNLAEIEPCNPQQSFFQYFIAALDRSEHTSFLPHLRSGSFTETTFAVKQPAIHALLSRRDTMGDKGAALQSFRLIWPDCSIPLDEGSSERAQSILALRGLVEQGMSIHVGPVGHNLV